MKSALKYVTIFTLILLLISCATSNNKPSVEEAKVVEETQKVDDKLIGVVEKNNECGFVIRVKNESHETVYLPDNLETLLQIENIRVKFSHEILNQKPSYKCSVVVPIHLTYITRLR